MNLKCEPLLIDALRTETGFYPAYHMNKEHWNSIILDGSVPDEDIKLMISDSYDLTINKNVKR